VLGLDQQVTRDGVRLGQRGGDVVDARRRDRGSTQRLHPLLDRLLGEDLLEQWQQHVAVAVAIGERREGRVVSPLRALDDDGQPLPELLLGAAHDHPAVLGLEGLERHQRRVCGVAGADGGEARVEVPRGRVGQQAHRGVVETDVAVHADAVAPGGVDAREERDRRDEAAAVVDHREAGLRRRTLRVARQVHPAGQGLQDVVVARLLRPRTGHAEAGQRAADDCRVEVLEVVVGDLDLGRHVAAQVAVDRVADRDQVLEDRAPGRGRQVQREAGLVAVEGLEEERVLPLGVRRDVAADVAADPRVLDLDHLGTEIGEVDTAERAGAVLLDGDDADVLQRLHRDAPV
jgi:hypothetical protein